MHEAGVVKVTIFGEQYTIKTIESVEHIENAAAMVDTTMSEIAKNTTMDPKHIAVLTALRIAYQLKALQEVGTASSLVNYINHELDKLGY